MPALRAGLRLLVCMCPSTSRPQPNLGIVDEDVSGDESQITVPFVLVCVSSGVALRIQMWVGGLSPPVSKLPRGELVNHLLGLGGLPAELKDERVLLDRFLPTIRADYA